MELIKVVITSIKKQSDLIVDKYSLEAIKKNSINTKIEVFEGMRKTGESEEKLVLILSKNGKKGILSATNYAFDNYLVHKIINIGSCEALSSTDIKSGDILLPNTFLSNSNNNPIFLDYATGENYDLVKFGLILNGISLSLDKKLDNKEDLQVLKQKYSADILENEAYFMLNIAQKMEKLDKCVVIKTVLEDSQDDLDNTLKNSIEILDFIL